MDPAQRERLQNQMLLLQYPKLILSLIFGIPALAFALVAGDIQIMNEEWHNSYYVKSSAEIIKNDVTQNRETYDHAIRYQYKVGDREISERAFLSSKKPGSVQHAGVSFSTDVGSTLPVYYDSKYPATHKLFEDPGVIFWTSVKRLTYLLLAVLTGIMVALLVVVFYRPKKTERRLPEKLGIPVSEIKIEDLKIKT
jgi:hypothetical protein